MRETGTNLKFSKDFETVRVYLNLICFSLVFGRGTIVLFAKTELHSFINLSKDQTVFSNFDFLVREKTGKSKYILFLTLPNVQKKRCIPDSRIFLFIFIICSFLKGDF